MQQPRLVATDVTPLVSRLWRPGGLRRAAPVLLLALLGWALVSLFIGVAQIAVRQGRDRQAAQALKNESQWRCRALQPAAVRVRCLALLQERPPADGAALQMLLADAAGDPAVP